jgi:adenine-specific DNA-methyltransferase
MSKQLGQYFTTDPELRKFVRNSISYTTGPVLEPSFGLGHLLRDAMVGNNLRLHVGVEIDSELKNKIVFQPTATTQLHWGKDFLTMNFDYKFKTIIGNPPYTKENGYVKFVEKCFDLLAEPGEMIFIVPSDFLNLTSAAPILGKMVTSGAFTHIWYPENERLFEGATIDVMAFRYEKNPHMPYPYKTRVVRRTTASVTTYAFENGRLVVAKENNRAISVDFSAFVGMVTGRDSVFKVPSGNIDVLTGQNKIEKYILADRFPTKNEEINKHLLAHKDELMARKITKQTDNNWFKWGALRNRGWMEHRMGSPCIYVKSLTRDKEVAFVGKVQYFGGNLICLVPTLEPNKINLQKMCDYLNSEEGRREYTFAGRYKMGQSLLLDIKYPPEKILAASQ